MIGLRKLGFTLGALVALASGSFASTPDSGPNPTEASVVAQEVSPALPLAVPGGELAPLRSLVDADLQRRLEARLKRSAIWARLIQQRRMAVGIVDLSNPEAVRFARVNGNVMMYAASLPKLAILLAMEQYLEDGLGTESAALERQMREMIAVSDNAAAAALYELMGFEFIEAVLTDPRYGLYDIERDGGLWVGKPYGKSGERHPDPLAQLTHGANVTQVCRFYYLLAFGRLVSTERSRHMLDMLVDPQLHHKFVHTLDVLVPDAELYRKSGTWRDWHSDSVLVWGPDWRRYILVGLIQSPQGSTILRNLVPAAEEVLQAR